MGRRTLKAPRKPNPLTPTRPELRLLVDEKAAAPIVGFTESWLQHDRSGARLVPHLKIGGVVRYVVEELWEVVQEWRQDRDAGLPLGTTRAALKSAMKQRLPALPAAPPGPPQGEAPPKRGRGRPRKSVAEVV